MANITDSAYGKNLWIAAGFKYVPSNLQQASVPEEPIMFTSTKPSFAQGERTKVTLPFTDQTTQQKNRITAVTSGDNKFVCIQVQGNNSNIAYSIDSVNWSLSKTITAVGVTQNLIDITYGQNNWVAIGDEGGSATIVYSNDITIVNNWTNIGAVTPGARELKCIFHNNNIFHVFGNQGTYIISYDDGLSWVDAGALPNTYNNFNINGVDYDEVNNVLVICGDDGTDGFYATRIGNVWDPNPTALKTGTTYHSVAFTNNHFYIGGSNGSLHIAEANATALVFNEDTTNATGHINTLSYAKDTLLIGLVGQGGVDADNDGQVDMDTTGIAPIQIVIQDGGVANKLDAGDREITLGGDLITEGDFTTIGCNVVIEAISDHSHDDNQKKLTLHGDLEISNKNIAFDSNNDNHKITVTSNTTIDQNLSQNSAVTFSNITLGSGAPGGSGSVASINYVQDQTDFKALYDAADTANASTTDAKLNVLLAALGITAAAGGSSGGSVSGSKVTNGLIRINKLDANLNIDNNQWLTSAGNFNGTNDDPETYLAVTNINGEFVLSDTIKNALQAPNYHEVVSQIITQQMIVDDNSSFASTLVDRPTYDSSSGVAEEIQKSAIIQTWPTTDHLSLNYATTLGSF